MGKRGGNFLAQMISTCLPSSSGRGGGGGGARQPVGTTPHRHGRQIYNKKKVTAKKRLVFRAQPFPMAFQMVVDRKDHIKKDTDG